MFDFLSLISKFYLNVNSNSANVAKTRNGIAEAYSEPCQTSKMERFTTQVIAVREQSN